MIQKVTLFCFFCVCIFGCRDSVNNIETPKKPFHDLHIEGEIKFHGKISWSASDDSINTKIAIENVGTDTAIIKTGHCAFNIIAYSQDNEPVWYNRPPDKFICLDESLSYKVAPEETKQLNDQMYISGKTWYRDIPAGDWDFVIESHTEKGKSISFKTIETN